MTSWERFILVLDHAITLGRDLDQEQAQRQAGYPTLCGVNARQLLLHTWREELTRIQAQALLIAGNQ